MVYLHGEGTHGSQPLCCHPQQGERHVPAVSPSPPPAHLRAFRSPSVLVEGWSFKTLMQPFI